ncbi:hypothetical protein H6F89_34045 [Cyanobacteria bacterium FACHB-63]|nr:hypothetical protein [Cyanobacteria bacterium FACHB-63]
MKAERRAKQMIWAGSNVLVTTLVESGIAGIWAWGVTDGEKAGTRIERAEADALRQFDKGQSDGLRTVIFEESLYILGSPSISNKIDLG